MRKKTEASGNGEASTARRWAEAAHGAIDETAEKAEAVEAKWRKQAHQAGEKVEASQEQAVEQISHSISELEAFAKKRPATAAGIAFALGVLTTALLRR
jgi:ElaB/YqjD/DUF883 family membrane-anchored ribosome-binding protein